MGGFDGCVHDEAAPSSFPRFSGLRVLRLTSFACLLIPLPNAKSVGFLLLRSFMVFSLFVTPAANLENLISLPSSVGDELSAGRSRGELFPFPALGRSRLIWLSLVP